MPIINTLLTARDNMSNVVNNLSDNVQKAKKKIVDNLAETGESVVSLESIFNSMRNTSITSFEDVMDYIKQLKRL